VAQWTEHQSRCVTPYHPDLPQLAAAVRVYQIQGRSIQLAVGRPAKKHRAPYVKIEKDIAQAKLNYGLQMGKVFCYIFPDVTAMDSFSELSSIDAGLLRSCEAI